MRQNRRGFLRLIGAGGASGVIGSAARQAMRETPYRRRRDYNPEDTLRFHARRLREARLIKSSPQQLIEQGTDWRFIEHLKKEIKT